MLALYKVELVVAAFVEPAVTGVLGKPRAPATLCAHPRRDDHYRDRDAGDCERDEQSGLIEDGSAVLFFQRVENFAIPDVQSVLHEKLCENENEQARRHEPGNAALIAGPETERRLPEAAHEGFLHRPIGFC